MAAHSSNPRPWEAEAAELCVWGPPDLQSELQHNQDCHTEKTCPKK